jgi:hypothetical protein
VKEGMGDRDKMLKTAVTLDTMAQRLQLTGSEQLE